MDGNLSREGITADLEAMRRAGLGGVIIMEVDVGVPRGPVQFMSRAWRELFQHVASEAARLGLEIDLNASPGWTGSGGPWIKPAQSMQKLVSAETNLAGPACFRGALPQPETREGFYRDVAVLAFPALPAGAFRIPDLAEKALYQRGHYSSEPGVKSFIPVPAGAGALPADQVIDPRRLVDVTPCLAAGGRLDWDVPAGQWTVVRFGHTSTGANTRPAPEPGVGLECDKLEPTALDAHFEAFIGTLLRDLGPRARRSLTGVHIDSWEMGPQNWTARFAEEFKHRRGYDPLPYLPVMTGRVVADREVSERFLWDLRQTVQDLIVEQHARHLRELAHRRHLRLSIEPYDGTPCDDLTYGAVADVPMCEFWSNCFATWFSCAEATSIAHTYGQRVIAAEAFTADDKERWQFHPATLKGLGDWAFCAGINRLVIHRYAHQPWLGRWPGMTMGPYGVHHERTQTWWGMVPAYHQYLARCQFLLQQGVAVADVCYLTPEGAPHVFRPPQSALRGSPPDPVAFHFDACTPEALLTRATVAHGRLVFRQGTTYQLLVLPSVETMTPALLQRVRALVRAGAAVLGTPPDRSPSLAGYPACDSEVRRLAVELWGAATASGELTERKVGAGRDFPGVRTTDLYPAVGVAQDVLARLRVPPDFTSPAALRHTHRRVGDVDLYFVANPASVWVGACGTFRVAGKSVEIWNPLTGDSRPAVGCEENEGRTTVPLWLEPSGSRFVVFRPHRGRTRPDRLVAFTRNGLSLLPACDQVFHEPPAAEILSRPGQPPRVVAWQPGRYEWKTVARPPHVFDVAVVPPSLPLTGPWAVRFQPGRGAPAEAAFDRLGDWALHADEGIRHFAGVAVYRLKFMVPRELVAEPRPVRLNLGRVEVMAAVTLNGRDLGVLWKAPFQVDITGALEAGTNILEVRVANLWPNRLIGDAAVPPERRVTWTTWNPFAPNTPLLPSGLFGPVTLDWGQCEE
jgi:hypothetical protein